MHIALFILTALLLLGSHTQEHLGNDISDLDVAMPAGTGDAEFMASLRGHLPALLDSFRPDLVLYDAGVDP